MKVNQSTSNATQSTDAGALKKAKATEAQSASSKKTGAPAQKADVPVESGAKADISSKAKEFSKAKEVATGAPDVREQKIAELKKRIEEGKYKVNPEAVADKMIKEHAQTAALE